MSICDLCQLSSPAMGCTRLSGEDCLKDALQLIRASATNGDVIKALFPKVPIKIFKSMNTVTFGSTQFDLDWWNAPYKVGDTEESDAEFMCRVMSKTVNKSTDDRNFIGGF